MNGGELPPGFVVAGKYVIERTLGRGGMGTVYRVRHGTTGKRMAMKCMLPALVTDAELVGRFMREARAMGRVQHRHVVDIFDVGRDGEVLYIVMELLEGTTLSGLLGAPTTTLEDALIIMLRAMEGVAAAHAHGIVHRDLKPENIFVCSGAGGKLDDPRVLDFGISKLDDASDPQLTRTGVAMGTPYYMALEQLNGERDVDHRADVYAMGVILYEAMAGVLPFRGDTPSAIAIRMLTRPPEELAALRPDVPAALCAVVMTAISRARDDRPATMNAFIDALRAALPSPLGAAPSSNPVPLRTPLEQRAARQPNHVSEIRAGSAAEPAAPKRARGRIKTGFAALALSCGVVALFALRPSARVEAPPPSIPTPRVEPTAVLAGGSATLDIREDARAATDKTRPDARAEVEASHDAGAAHTGQAGVAARSAATGRRKAKTIATSPATKRAEGSATTGAAQLAARASQTAPAPAVPAATPEPSAPANTNAQGRAGVLGLGDFVGPATTDGR